jgi:hypothetical protein
MPADPYPADCSESGNRVKASPRVARMTARSAAALGALVLLAGLAGWAGHRVYHRVSRVLAARAAAGPRPDSPLARADRRAYRLGAARPPHAG